jgi:hypothetical protein
MAAQNHTVTNHSCALNVAGLIIAKNAKNKETPGKCAVFGGNHPANYSGCEYYHNLIKRKNSFRNNTQHTQPVNTNIYRNNIKHSGNSQQQRNYADVTKNNTNQVEDTAIIINNIFG